MSPSTTISAGSAPAAGKERSSARKPCFEIMSSGRVLIPEVPMFMPRTGEPAARRSTPAATRLTAGRRVTQN